MWKENNPILRKLRKFTIKALSKWDDPPYNEHRLWKMGVERLLSFWKRAYFSENILILGSVCSQPHDPSVQKHQTICNVVCNLMIVTQYNMEQVSKIIIGVFVGERICLDLFLRHVGKSRSPLGLQWYRAIQLWSDGNRPIGQASQGQKHGQSI